MNDPIVEFQPESFESVSYEFRDLISMVSTASVAYVRKLAIVEDSRMLFDEMTPEEIVVSTMLPSIYFLNGRERLPLWADDIRALTYPKKQSGDLRCVAVATGTQAFEYELYEDISGAVAGPPVYMQPLAGIKERSWLDKSDRTVRRLR